MDVQKIFLTAGLLCSLVACSTTNYTPPEGAETITLTVSNQTPLGMKVHFFQGPLDCSSPQLLSLFSRGRIKELLLPYTDVITIRYNIQEDQSVDDGNSTFFYWSVINSFEPEPDYKYEMTVAMKSKQLYMNLLEVDPEGNKIQIESTFRGHTRNTPEENACSKRRHVI
jgi:hypothetical protein